MVRDMLYEFAEKKQLGGAGGGLAGSGGVSLANSGSGGATGSFGGVGGGGGAGAGGSGDDSLCEQYLVYALCRSTAATGGFKDKVRGQVRRSRSN